MTSEFTARPRLSDAPATVVAVGDADTLSRAQTLAEAAKQQGKRIIEFRQLPEAAMVARGELDELPAAVDALGTAIRLRAGLWLPFPHEDLGREDHVRRICLALSRQGLPLYVGREFIEISPDAGFSPVDFALKQEVRAVDRLHSAALASAATDLLETDLIHALFNKAEEQRETALAHDRPQADIVRAPIAELEKRFGPPPPLASADTPWRELEPQVAGLAEYLTRDCHLSQLKAAQVLNDLGYRTRTGRLWNRTAVGRLVARGRTRREGENADE